eukprot:gb/GECG01012992.1/.p1 GENE.gb/GECG01012992.1/~~gb/GECG01012992.1/.p1  ORF type:complete len:379 (+),score=40.45 gb/GECG01012992.1/:1-1137(+)
MSTTRKHFVLGSRESNLALAQTRTVKALLESAYPELTFEIKTKPTRGDEQLQEHLAKLVGNNPGLFTKELEALLLAREVDMVVHSLKDVPTSLPEGLILSAISESAAPEDAFVLSSKHEGKFPSLAELPNGSLVGTSSLRREAIIRHYYPQLRVDTIRGNLNTRLKKLDDPIGQYDAIVLATAGLERLEFYDRITRKLPAEEFPYGVSQGALGIECRIDDIEAIAVSKAAMNLESTARCLAERGFLKTLQGGCQIPIGVHTSVSCPQGDSATDSLRISFSAVVLSRDGKERMTCEKQGDITGITDTLRNAMAQRNYFKSHQSGSRHSLTGLCSLEVDDELNSCAEHFGASIARQMIDDGVEKILGSLEGERPITYGKA